MPEETERDPISELVEASEALERVRIDLDLSQTTCKTCGAHRANNWEDAKRAKALTAAINRIDATLTDLQSRPSVFYKNAPRKDDA